MAFIAKASECKAEVRALDPCPPRYGTVAWTGYSLWLKSDLFAGASNSKGGPSFGPVPFCNRGVSQSALGGGVMPSVRLHWGCKASETVDGEARKCTREHYAHAYCKRHYTASAKGIDPNSLPPLERRPVERPSRAKEPKAPPADVIAASCN